jgi:hypothetical protein
MFFKLISSNDIVHRAHTSALVIDDKGLPHYLPDDRWTASYLGSLSRKITSESEAMDLVRTFALMRGYKIALTPPIGEDARIRHKKPIPKREETDYNFFAEDGEAWTVYATFYTSEYSRCYFRYVFRIFKEPGSGLHFKEPTMIHIGTYVF